MRVSFLPLLGLLFIALKLGFVIEWSWLWVLAPFWIWAAILAMLFGTWVTIAALAAVGIYSSKRVLLNRRRW